MRTTLLLLLVSPLSANAAWYVGHWKVDVATTKSVLGKDYESLAGMAVAFMKKRTYLLLKLK